ncbi:Homeodomain-like protein [Cynara cardunculus var. scolymus]|uniref:Homeodomain-like protein n=1 Tax=Cynara cardunculus var. scolymus TaxID=59895 RepID=A0A103YI33_CYNCS|nr:Homeodomain-like protein [Cynara cardunculus var. scolymus]
MNFCIYVSKELGTNFIGFLINPATKQTRQWAAWTRQEEESFFNALHHNFEKITSCVQSKNKDQVRHYHYRLVRPVNKLLDPELSLDAKNSKDTNAVMLRWWSLLEKHSCKASKFHLKPRRFKIFLATLLSVFASDDSFSFTKLKIFLYHEGAPTIERPGEEFKKTSFSGGKTILYITCCLKSG